MKTDMKLGYGLLYLYYTLAAFAVRRVADALTRPDMFVERPIPVKQQALEL